MHLTTKLKTLNRKVNKTSRSKKLAGAVILLFVIVGTYIILTVHASTNTIALESESGTVTSGATVGSDINASGGKYLQFGNSVVNPPSTGTEAQLISLIQDVTTAKGYRYTSKDNLNNTMDTVKIIDNPAGGYLAVYHSGNVSRLATSTNLLQWTYKVIIDSSASQPTIMATSDGGFVTAAEYNNGTGGGGQVRVRHYANLAALYAANFDKSITTTRTLSNCNEGTPNIYSVKLNPNIDNSVIDIGMHYHNNCDTDRQARATLTNFTNWVATKQTNIDTALISAATAAGQIVGGNIGDRDGLTYGGVLYDIHEVQYSKGSTGQNNSFASWRPYLYNFQTGAAKLLQMKTHHGSTAFANPTFTLVKGPDGSPSIVVTMFIPSEGSGTYEAGPLIYYKPLP